MHYKYAPEEKIVFKIEKNWVKKKGVAFEVSNGNMSKRDMKKAATRLFEFKFLKSAKRKRIKRTVRLFQFKFSKSTKRKRIEREESLSV